MLHSPSGFPSRISCRIIGCDFSSPDTFTYCLLKAVSCKYHATIFYNALGGFWAHAVTVERFIKNGFELCPFRTVHEVLQHPAAVMRILIIPPVGRMKFPHPPTDRNAEKSCRVDHRLIQKIPFFLLKRIGGEGQEEPEESVMQSWRNS